MTTFDVQSIYPWRVAVQAARKGSLFSGDDGDDGGDDGGDGGGNDEAGPDILDIVLAAEAPEVERTSGKCRGQSGGGGGGIDSDDDMPQDDLVVEEEDEEDNAAAEACDDDGFDIVIAVVGVIVSK